MLIVDQYSYIRTAHRVYGEKDKTDCHEMTVTFKK